jgi:hypothetical protein
MARITLGTRLICTDCGTENHSRGWCATCGSGTQEVRVNVVGPDDDWRDGTAVAVPLAS